MSASDDQVELVGPPRISLAEYDVHAANAQTAAQARRARFMLGVLTLVNLFNYVDRYAPAATKDLIKEDLGLTDTQTAIPMSAFLVVYMCAAPVFGRLADRGEWSRVHLLAAGVVLWSLATAAAAGAWDFWSYLAARALVGVGEAAYATIAPAMISDHFPSRQRTAVFAIFNAAIPVGAALGFALGGAVGEHWGWRAAFLVCAAPGLVLAGLVLRVTDEHRQGVVDRVPFRAMLRRLWNTRGYVRVVAGQTALSFGAGALADWLPSYLVRYQASLSTATAGVVVGAATVVGGLAGTALGAAAARRATEVVAEAKANFGVSGVSVGVSAVCSLVTLVLVDDLAMAISMIVLTQVFLWAYQGPTNAELVRSVSVARGQAFAISIFITHALGDAVSPVIVGVVSDATGSLRTALVAAPLAFVVASAVWTATAWGLW